MFRHHIVIFSRSANMKREPPSPLNNEPTYVPDFDYDGEGYYLQDDNDEPLDLRMSPPTQSSGWFDNYNIAGCLPSSYFHHVETVERASF